MRRTKLVGWLHALSWLLLASHLSAADALSTWTWRNPLTNGNTLNGVTYAAGLIVGVGNCGTIMVGTNLTAAWWNQVPMGTNSATLNAITYGNGTFVIAAGDSPDGDNTKRFLTSTDGLNWFIQTYTNSSGRSMKGIAYGAGQFVAVGERAEIWTSPDGTNWTKRVSPQTGSSYSLNAITYRPDAGFVAVGDAVSSKAEIVTSPDGITWTLQNVSVPANTLAGVTWGYITNGDLTVTTNFVAVGGKDNTEGTIATSPDGVLWTQQTSYTLRKFYAAAFKPGVGYIAVAMGAVVQTSTDGTNWNSSYSDISNPVNVPGNDFKGAVYASDLDYFVAVGNSGQVETSPDGSPGSWTAEFWGRPENLTGVARGHSNFVVVGNNVPYIPNYGVVLTSPDGLRWKVRDSKTPASIKLNNVTYANGLFVAVGNSGTIVTSSDEGTNWTQQISGVGANLSGISYITNSVTNVFLVAGASGTLLTSPDGTNWSAQTFGSTALYCSCPTFAAGVYVVGGASGTILTSPDLTTWTAATTGMTRDVNGIAYASNTFVAACSYGYVLTSTTGSTWARQVSPLGSDGSSSRAYNAILSVNGQFVMGGSSTFPPCAVLTSSDGTNWTIVAKPQTSSAFKALSYVADTYVGVGNGGMIMQAGSLAIPQPLIQYSYTNGTLQVEWPGGGTLQVSPDVVGPYTNVTGASSPYSVTTQSDASLFFRVQIP